MELPTEAFSTIRWKKLSNHDRNVILQKMKLPYTVERNQYFTGPGRHHDTPCSLDEVLSAVNRVIKAANQTDRDI